MQKIIALVICAVVPCFGFAIENASATIPEGTKVRVRLEQQLSSATADEGQPVQLSVVEAVFVNEVEVIPSGASVHGAVVTAVPKRRMGRTGKLDFSIYACRLSDFHRTAHCVLTVCVSRGGKRTHEFPTLYGADRRIVCRDLRFRRLGLSSSPALRHSRWAGSPIRRRTSLSRPPPLMNPCNFPGLFARMVHF